MHNGIIPGCFKIQNVSKQHIFNNISTNTIPDQYSLNINFSEMGHFSAQLLCFMYIGLLKIIIIKEIIKNLIFDF